MLFTCLYRHQQQQQSKQLSIGKSDASEHPEYIRLMSQLDQSKKERLQKVENWRNFELQSIHDWFVAQKKQAWDDFYVRCRDKFLSCSFNPFKVLRCTLCKVLT